MKSEKFTYIISAFALVILVNTASAAINITDADAIYEVNLSTVSVPTSPVPIKTVFVINADASLDQNLSSVSILTQPSPLKEIFIINEDAALKKNLSTVNIPTEPLPVKEIFIHLEDAKYSEELLFPKELINDITPPIISNITVTNITENSATIKWDTDEFADSLVKYGTSSGAYTKQEYDELFVKKHTVSLYNLSPGTKYYFVVKSVDLSGNSAESSEYSFTTSGALNQPPIANFTYSPEKPVVNQPVTFDASSSYDPDGNIISYEWNFGDGNITNTTHEIIKHSYSEAGSYEVTLTVKDDEGATNSTTKIITVYSGAIFDTGSSRNPYPSIMGTHKGTIKPNKTIIATKL
ncbi:MAG: PKD domain-containing protein, partial [Candidatus Methanospirare jalkutatii]|nr:PKD domain-containing protein [Candidatus Methanospirare jalkutatii]